MNAEVMNENFATILTESGERLAYQYVPIGDTTLVYLPGFNSDMCGRKALHLSASAKECGVGFLSLEYRGHGRSDGKLEDGGICQWTDDARSVIQCVTTGEDLIFVGASMGLWVALRLALMDENWPLGIVGIGGAVDVHGDHAMRRLSKAQSRELEDCGVTWRPSRYGDGPYPLTRTMIEEGRRAAVRDALVKLDPLPFSLRLLHGMRDPELEWQHACELAELVRGDVQVQLIREGDHRLSGDSDLCVLGTVVRELLKECGVTRDA